MGKMGGTQRMLRKRYGFAVDDRSATLSCVTTDYDANVTSLFAVGRVVVDGVVLQLFERAVREAGPGGGVRGCVTGRFIESVLIRDEY